ncbi:MAG: response regulator [Candidatus Latescibacterota bacterium]
MSRASVLIVDDERNIRLTLKQALGALDVETVAAVNGEEALDWVAQRRFNLVLLDLRLPGIQGMEVLRRLRHTRPELDLVVLTAYGTVDSAVEALRLGALHFVQKPFAPDEIREVVAAALERRTRGQDAEQEYEAAVARARQALADGRPVVARDEVRRALTLLPYQPEALNLLGAALEESRDTSAAEYYYRAAASLDPRYGPARRNLERITSPNRRGPVDVGPADAAGPGTKGTK